MRAVIVGMGEVGRRVADGARKCDVEVIEVRRGQSLSDAMASADGPIVLAMREDDFEAPFRAAIAARPSDVVVLQNGFVDEVLAGHQVTRGVLWFTAKGEFFANARETLLAGPWADALSSWLRAAAVVPRVVTQDVAAREGREKAAWSCLVGPGVYAHESTFAALVERDERTARRIVAEACEVASRALGAETSAEAAWSMVSDTVGPLGWMRGGPKGLAWRSGKVVRWAEDVLGDGYAAVENAEIVRRILAR